MARPSANNDPRALGNEIEKLGDVGIPKTNAAVAGRRSDEVFAIGPVKINVTVPRICILLFQT